MKLRVGALRHHPTFPASSSGASLRLLDLAPICAFTHLRSSLVWFRAVCLGSFSATSCRLLRQKGVLVASELRLRSEQARSDRLWLSGASSQCKPPSDIRRFTENSRA